MKMEINKDNGAEGKALKGLNEPKAPPICGTVSIPEKTEAKTDARMNLSSAQEGALKGSAGPSGHFDGIININKEAGMTSSDVVARLRRILGQKKIGHTGTLDPMATGVLPICVGKATRLSDYIMEKDKVYVAGLTLGAETDTQDSEGEIIFRSDKIAGREEILEALPAFTGEIMQTPPMYSALKIGGKKLYEYARAGQEIRREPRRVTVYKLELLDEIGENQFILRVHCSKGTYIRTICADLGKKLGTGGYMSSLVRTRAGCYDISEAFTLGQIEEMVSLNDHSFLRPMDEPLLKFRRADIRPEFDKQFLNGAALKAEMYISEKLSEGERVRVYFNGGFRALSVMREGKLKILCLLA